MKLPNKVFWELAPVIWLALMGFFLFGYAIGLKHGRAEQQVAKSTGEK